MARSGRWLVLSFAALYLILLAVHFRGIVTTVNLDADAVSAPVIGQLFGAAPAHAHVILGEFGWYATLLFELATKWLPGHREIWLGAPYAMSLAGAGLVAWASGQVAGRFAAALSLALLVCLAPVTLRLLLSMTQHAPDWFCLAVLSAWLVALTRPPARRRSRLLWLVGPVVGIVVGVNAASDPLLIVAGLVPFACALGVAAGSTTAAERRRMAGLAALTLVVAGAVWGGTLAGMSALNVAPEPGLHTDALAGPHQVVSNAGLWLQGVSVLWNGGFFGRELGFTVGLAVLCACIGVAAMLLLPRLAWTAARAAPQPDRLAYLTFWSVSAILLSAAFVLSATPVDVHAARYIVGLVYAGAAVVPVAAAARRLTQVAALTGTCVVALAGVVALAQGVPSRNSENFPTPATAARVAAIAAREHAAVGYAAYWDAAPITWSAHFRVRVYPVSICDQGQHLCPFDLHIITSWYEPRSATRTFLLADPIRAMAPVPGLGRPDAVYRVGAFTMYVYPYDVAARMAVT